MASAADDLWMDADASGNPGMEVPVSSPLVNTCTSAAHGYPVYGGDGLSDVLTMNCVCCAIRDSFTSMVNTSRYPTPPWTALDQYLHTEERMMYP